MLKISRLFDRFYAFWESKPNNRRVGGVLVAAFLISIVLTLLQELDLLPAFLGDWLSINRHFAIHVAFTLLLIVELIGLVFALARSVSTSLVKQFEIFSLILLRSAFKQFGDLAPNLNWHDAIEPVSAMLSDAFGALVIFVLILLISRIQKHTPITKDPVEQTRFVLFKKNSAMLLFVLFFLSGIFDIVLFFQNREVFDFFTNFYNILIFNDILLVLISLRYNYSFIIVFRNSAFAVATLMIRMALTAPPFFNAILGILASVFALGVVFYYNKFVSHLLPDKN